MNKKLLGAFAVMAVAGSVYSWMYLACIASHSDVSQEDYARMSQEIVKQSLQEK